MSNKVSAVTPDRVYRGVRENGETKVFVEFNSRSRRLPLCLHVRRHSPTGFEWGYAGSGPAQLSLAMLVDAFDGDMARAEAIYQTFKRVICKLHPTKFEITRSEVLAQVEQMEQEKRT